MSSVSLANQKSEVAANIFSDLSRVLNSTGIPAQPFHPRNLETFASLPSERQEAIVAHFEAYLETVKTAILDPRKQDLTLEQEKALLAKTLKRLGLRHSEGSEEMLETGHIIEVYDQHSVQLYRNFEFFRHSSYSLMDVVTTEWFRLYQRPQKITDALIECARQVFIHGKPVVPEVSEHILREIYSGARKAYLLKVKAIYPLFEEKTGACTAILTKIKAELIAEDSDADRIGIA
ncbi:MAG TPA: hypothetical protein VFV50_10155 [Bdellovibrionales bacterium]|nr:hypothetical protein [Bdellovibrionales bacterium]